MRRVANSDGCRSQLVPAEWRPGRSAHGAAAAARRAALSPPLPGRPARDSGDHRGTSVHAHNRPANCRDLAQIAPTSTGPADSEATAGDRRVHPPRTLSAGEANLIRVRHWIQQAASPQ